MVAAANVDIEQRRRAWAAVEGAARRRRQRDAGVR